MKTTQDIVNDSGYPLQIHLEELIEETKQNHGWRVLAREHRWVNKETNDEGYIDLILERSHFSLRLVVECKRIIGSWTFLLQESRQHFRYEVRALSIDYSKFKFLWNKINIFPESSEASFCVMETCGKKDSRTLEGIAGELLLSLEYFAIEENELIKLVGSTIQPPPKNMFYIPIIVTTADLQTIEFDPSKVDIKSGQIDESKTHSIEFIKFRKNLATYIDYEKPTTTTVRELNEENDRTVFVVKAESLIRFLGMIGECK